MKNLTPEMIEKAKAAKSAEELLELAKANGFDMSADEAKTCFAQLNPKSGELDDDALDGVAGGCGGTGNSSNDSDDDNVALGSTVRVINGDTCPQCGGTEGKVGALSLSGIGCSTTIVNCCKCNMAITSGNSLKVGIDVEYV